MAHLTTDPDDAALSALLADLRRDRLAFFPVRHHSPACALHLARLLHELRPAAVLIEGPADATALIPLLLDEDARPPFAFYCTYAPPGGSRHGAEDAAEAPSRCASWYPFCEYSPELVALRVGHELGAELRFIDLTFAQGVHAQAGPRDEQQAVRVWSLLQEAHLAHSRYLALLARRQGCRDQDELWDHLFEATALQTDTEDFCAAVATYCYLARREYTAELLAADGTTAREAAMARAVREARQETPRGAWIVVVTGGFHTAALPGLVRQARPPRAPATPPAAETLTLLTRYSYPQLDALSGYASGMPSPGYYQALWEHLNASVRPTLLPGAAASTAEPYTETARGLLVELGRSLRARDLPFSLSVADEIVALEHALGLAALRGHPGPTREDLLDAVRSCYVKGSLETEGAEVLRCVQEVLCGSAVGRVPAAAGVPPLVEDFRATAARLRIDLEAVTPHRVTLDLYRRPAHRLTSRFFHCLQSLGVPFARLQSGPDFVTGRGADLLHEAWDYCWWPETEGALIERAVYGPSVSEAATGRLLEQVQALEHQGQGRNAARAVALLVSAYRMGLQAQVPRLLGLIEPALAEDPAFVSLVAGLRQLVLLRHFREPLEAGDLVEVTRLTGTAYRRATYLLQELGSCPPELVNDSLGGLRALRELVSGDESELLDAELLLGAAASLLAQPAAEAAIVGGAAGVLYAEGRLGEERLAMLLAGYLGGAASDPARKTGFLRGLLQTARALAWQSAGLLRRVNTLLGEWEHEDFIANLPDLRLAFADLTPRELDLVAEQVGQLHGLSGSALLLPPTLSPGDLAAGLAAEQAVRRSLQRDALGSWLGGDADA